MNKKTMLQGRKKKVNKKYLLLCNKHDSLYGGEWALFWGDRESKNGYTSDLRIAHRFDESEIKQYEDDENIPIPIDILNISEKYKSEEEINKNYLVLIEKGTLNDMLNLNLSPSKSNKKYCPCCGERID